jgi:hypothetical protein
MDGFHCEVPVNETAVLLVDGAAAVNSARKGLGLKLVARDRAAISAACCAGNRWNLIVTSEQNNADIGDRFSRLAARAPTMGERAEECLK